MKYEEVYDHQMTICDPNEDHYNNLMKRCLYGKISSEYLYEYAKQFWVEYKNNRKFMTIISNDGHEGTLQVIKYTDKIIYNFLVYLYNNNLFKESIIFLLSDHGASMPSLYYLSDFYKIEYYLPMLYIIIHDKKNLTYKLQYENINKNQQTFISAYDIYNTISNIIYGDKYILLNNKTKYKDTPKSPFGQSLFYKINPNLRYPKLNNGMNKKICV